MYTFDDIATVQSTLDRLATREAASETDPATTGPLTTQLPRQPGARESRYAHLLSGIPDLSAASPHPSTATAPSAEAGRIAQLEQEVAALTNAFSALQSRIERLESSLS
jgi:uncharacterized protein YceH (UPF0502 family)